MPFSLKPEQSIVSQSGNYYKVLDYLGSGANAHAYRCLCTSGLLYGMEFVVKIQYNLSSESRRERFLREQSFLESCNHPAILRQFDFGTFETASEKYPFIVTNYMPTTLSNVMKNGIPFVTKVKYSCQLLSAVRFLQNSRIIHRDIKPNNIFIDNNNAFLGDFGLIKKIKPTSATVDEDDVELVNETVMAALDGYVAMAKYYRTPELVNYANKTDCLHVESDVFQLGLVLAVLFTGENPLQATDNIRSPIVLNRIKYIDFPQYGGAIHNTIEKMLDLDYMRRIKITLALDSFTGIYQSLLLNK